MDLSVVIATHNRIDQLKRVIPSLLNQPIGFELVIVDDGSRDGTHKWIDTLDISCLKLIRISTHGWRNPAYAKNLGVCCAEGEIIVVQDGEILHEDTENLRRVVDHFHAWDKPDVPLSVRPLSLWHERKSSIGRIGSVFQERYVKVGIFTAMWRDDFIWLGGFNEFYTQWGHEDVDFIRRARCAGFEVIQDPEIKIRHLAHETVPDSEGDLARHVEEGKYQTEFAAGVEGGTISPCIEWNH